MAVEVEPILKISVAVRVVPELSSFVMRFVLQLKLNLDRRRFFNLPVQVVVLGTCLRMSLLFPYWLSAVVAVEEEMLLAVVAAVVFITIQLFLSPPIHLSQFALEQAA